jgi:hypothetical protein
MWLCLDTKEPPCPVPGWAARVHLMVSSLVAPPAPGLLVTVVRLPERGRDRAAVEHQARRLDCVRPQHHAPHGKGQLLRPQRYSVRR